MWSPGLLLLLLGSACLLVLSAPGGSPSSSGPNEEQPEEKVSNNKMFAKLKNKGKALLNWSSKNPKKIANAAASILEYFGLDKLAKALRYGMAIPSEGQEDMDTLKTELKALDIKLDTFGAEMKWGAGAGGAYQMTVINIEKAWVKYNELGCSTQKATDAKKKALEDMFFTFYSQYADSISLLYQLLTAKPESITKNLPDVLADKLRCHEKDITSQFLYLNKLICKANILNDKYYEFKGANTEARVKIGQEMASQSASALVQSHHRCLSDSATYIERDIFEHTDDTKTQEEIAESVMKFLTKTYDKYQWMVFAYTTINTKDRPDVLKTHIYSGFTVVEKGSVTVAVAKQVKGDHTKAETIKKAIKDCLSRYKICIDIPTNINKCKEKVFGKSLSQVYTAAHAFKLKDHTATSTAEEPNDEESEILPEAPVNLIKTESSQISNVLIGDCGKKALKLIGKYIVFIKSDEELMGVNPCSKVKCEHNGKCVVVSGIAMCECQYPFYGEHCEKSLEEYKKSLLKELDGGKNAKGFCNSLRLDD